LKRFTPPLNTALTTLLVGLFSIGLLMLWPYGSAFMADQTYQEAKPKPTKSPEPTRPSTYLPTIIELPTDTPYPGVTEIPTEAPTEIPTDVPTEVPTEIPTEEFASPTPFPTFSFPTLTPTDPPSPTPVPTHQPTKTPKPTKTHSPSRTPTASRTPTVTRTPTTTMTRTATVTRTPTRTYTPGPSRTPGSSRTPAPTRTPGPSRTPDPTEGIIATYLTIDPVAPIALGRSANIVIHLVTVDRWPVADQSVALRMGNVHMRQARTDATGTATLVFQSDLPVGTYTVEAFFNGAKNLHLAASSATVQVEIVSTRIEIQVVPPLPGINFSLADRVFTSDANGLAQVDVSQIGAYSLELLPLETNIPDMRLEFIRWADESFSTKREVEVPMAKPLQLGLGVNYQVSLNFVDRESQLVPPKRITQLTLKGSDGNAYSFTDFNLHWLLANRVARRVDGLEVTPIQYSVDTVIIDGSNVVNSSQQRFYLKPNDVWIVQVLLYSAHFRAHDALFGFPMGAGINLQYPDGHSQDFLFDANNDLHLTDLARGLYRAQVLGVQGQGVAFLTPVALSRDQEVSLLVLSNFDLGLGGSLLTVLALGLLFGGRPHLLQPLLARWPKVRFGKPHV
jgi:hypothetical protein